MYHTNRYCKYFDGDYLEYDCRDNQTIAVDLLMYSSLIEEFMDEDNFRTTIYDTGIHICGRECLPLSSTKVMVRNTYNVFFNDIQAYQHYMCLHESAKTEYRRVHILHNDIIARAYTIVCKKFNKVLRRQIV